MAQLGNNLNYQMASAVPYMSEEHQAVVRSGIGLFELRLPYRSDRDRQIFGPFGVRVEETSDRHLRSTYSKKWMTMGNNLVNYVVDKKGNGVAFMPDDPWWHNRIFLMDSPNLNPVALHTDRGIINGAQVDIEIKILKQHLKCEKTIYEVVRNGKRIEFYNTQEEAQQAIDEMQEMALLTDKTTGAVITKATSRNKFSILPSTVIDYRPEIAEIIRKFKKMEFGWTSSEVFQTKIKPAIVADIKKAVMVQPAVSSATDIARALSSMSAEEKAAIRQALLEQPKQPVEEVDLSGDFPEQPVVEPVAPVAKKRGGRQKKAVQQVEVS